MDIQTLLSTVNINDITKITKNITISDYDKSIIISLETNTQVFKICYIVDDEDVLIDEQYIKFCARNQHDQTIITKAVWKPIDCQETKSIINDFDNIFINTDSSVKKLYL